MDVVAALFSLSKKLFNRALAFILCFGILGQGFAVDGIDGCPSPASSNLRFCLAKAQEWQRVCQTATASAIGDAGNLQNVQSSLGGTRLDCVGAKKGTQNAISDNDFEKIANAHCGKVNKDTASDCMFTASAAGPAAASAERAALQKYKSSVVKACSENLFASLKNGKDTGSLNTALGQLCGPQTATTAGGSTAGGSTAGADSAGGITAGEASSNGWLVPALVGAGLGALLGSMFGGDDESSSSSVDDEEPPSLPETPVAETPSSSSTSTASSVAVSQSSESISQPAIVTVPTVEPGEEAGSGDDEIFIAASGAIPDPDSVSSDSSASSANSDSATTGGSTAIGGTTGTDGSRDTDVVDNSTGTGNSSSINVVDDDETVVGLVSGSGGVSNRGLATFQYDSGASDSSAGATGGGSGMLTGLPTSRRSNGRNLASGSSSSASSKSSSSASSKSSSSSSSKGSSSSKSSSSSSSLTSAQAQQQRNSVVNSLISRGLISASSSSSSVRRK